MARIGGMARVGDPS